MAFHTVVMSGGGGHSLAFIGCARFLEHTRLGAMCKRFVGSSAGAIVAALMAMRLSSDEMDAWVGHMVDAHGLHRISLDEALALPKTLGVDSGARFEAAFRETAERWLGSPDATFLDLARARGTDLVVCALNTTARRFEYFCVDTTPGMPIALALRMSSSVPLVYAPVRHKGCLYVDPMFGRNFPFDFPGSRANDPGVLGLVVKRASGRAGAGERAEAYEPSLASFAADLSHAACGGLEHAARERRYTMVEFDVGDIPLLAVDAGSIAFAVDATLRAELARIGYVEAREALGERALGDRVLAAPPSQTTT